MSLPLFLYVQDASFIVFSIDARLAGFNSLLWVGLLLLNGIRPSLAVIRYSSALLKAAVVYHNI